MTVMDHAVSCENALKKMTGVLTSVDTAILAGDIIFNMFAGNSFVIIVGADGTIIKTWDVEHLPFGLKAGNKIPEGTVSFETVVTRKRCSRVVAKDKSKFGFGYVGIGVPIFDENKTILASLTITSPLNQQDTVKEISEELKLSVDTSVNARNNITVVSNEIIGTVGTLKDISVEVQKNIGVINDAIRLIQNVSDQTNLLGLNAAIEAARAGEQGKGFVIVAQEIRRLSDTVKSSIQELQKKLSGLSQKIEEINPKMVNLNDSITRQSESIEDINTVMEQLGASAKKLDDLANKSWM